MAAASPKGTSRPRLQLFGIPVGRRNDGLAGTDRVSQRSRRDLGRVEIRRDVNVGGADELDQFLDADKAVVKEDVVFHSAGARQALELQPIKLSFAPLDVRMGDAEQDVHRLRIALQNGGHGLDDILDALVRREQSKGKQDQLALHAEAVLVKVGVHKGDVGNAVRDPVDLILGYLVSLPQEPGAALTHDDQPIRALGQLFHDAALIRIRLAQDGVQRGHHRHAQLAQERQNVTAGRTAEDAVFVLQADEIHIVAVQEIRGPPVRGWVILHQLEAHARRIGVAVVGVVHGQGEASRLRVRGGDGLAQIGREGGNPALARQIIADEGDPPKWGLSCRVHNAAPPRTARFPIRPEGVLCPSIKESLNTSNVDAVRQVDAVKAGEGRLGREGADAVAPKVVVQLQSAAGLNVDVMPCAVGLHAQLLLLGHEAPLLDSRFFVSGSE
jgi:hypothetical protein